MTGITIHTEDPISSRVTTGEAAQGSTPQTADSNPRNNPSGPVSNPVPSTTTASGATPSQVARPGAALPQPTGSISTSHYTPPPPTRTQPLPSSQASQGPPPPQPGAVPVPPTSTYNPATQYTPAAPQPGSTASTNPYTPTPTTTATLNPPIQTPYQPAPLPLHQQSPNLHQPSRAQPVGYTTTSSFTDTYTDLSHPPGYQQNTRSSFEDRHTQDPFADQKRIPVLSAFQRDEDGGEGVWDQAKGWMKVAGDTLAEGEKKLWETINRGGK